jgi:hypothetical protein
MEGTINIEIWYPVEHIMKSKLNTRIWLPSWMVLMQGMEKSLLKHFQISSG